MSSGAVEAECAFVLVTETPGVNLKSWCAQRAQLNAVREQRGEQEEEELPFPLGSRLGPAACTEALFCVCASAEGQRLVAGSLKYGWVLLLEEFIYWGGRLLLYLFIISVARRSVLMSAKTLPDPPARFPWLCIVSGRSFLPPRTRSLASRSPARVTLQILRLVAGWQ